MVKVRNLKATKQKKKQKQESKKKERSKTKTEAKQKNSKKTDRAASGKPLQLDDIKQHNKHRKRGGDEEERQM